MNAKKEVKGKCFASWSGGKDSCLSLYKAIGEGFKPEKLLTMFSEENNISTAHRLSEEIYKAQSEAIGIEHVTGRTTFHEYENTFVSILKSFRTRGIEFGIFGDIDLQEHRDWVEKASAKASVTAVLPLWQMNRKDVLVEFLRTGFKARIILVNTEMLPVQFLGRDLSIKTMEEIEEAGADVCGENGEYHTVVYDGPIFKKALCLHYGSEVIPVGEKWAQIKVSI